MKKWGILIKKESKSLDFTGLKIPRDYYVIKEEKGDENEKQTTAETLTIEQGESFEIEKDFTGLALKKGEKAVFMDVVSEDGQ